MSYHKEEEALGPERPGSLQSFASHLTADFDTRPDQLAKLFNKLDVSGSGNVSYDQMMAGIRPMFPNFDPSQLRRVVEQIDTDGSGEVNQAEFITAIQEMAVQAFNRGTLEECFVYDYGPEIADRCQIDVEGSLSTAFLAKPLGHRVKVRWVCTVGDNAAFILRMVHHYELHPLLIEDLLYSAEQSKLERLGPSRLCLIYPSIKLYESEAVDAKLASLREYKLEVRNCSLLLLGSTILSFHRVESESIENCKSRISNSSSKIRTAPAGFLVFSLLQQEIEPLFKALSGYRKQLDIVQDLIDDEKPTPQAAIKVLQMAWREMNMLMFHLRPLSATLRALASHFEDDQDTASHVNQLRGRVDALLQQAESLQTSSRALKEDNAEKQAARMNRIMHTLTLVTVTFVPVQFLTGLWGMNFDAMPELHWDFGYKMFWILLGTVVVTVILFFKARGLL